MFSAMTTSWNDKENASTQDGGELCRYHLLRAFFVLRANPAAKPGY